MKCGNNNSCTKLDQNKNINGLNDNATVTKESTTETTRYPDGYKYKVSYSSTSNEAGYYKLEFENTNKKWKLVKVADLLSKWDESVLSKGTWTATYESSKLKVTVSETDQTKNGSNPSQAWTWECEITKSSSSNIDLSNKEGILKNKLGIVPSLDDQTIKDQKRKFVENCARSRNETQKTNASAESLTNPPNKIENTIIISSDDNFQKLFTGEVPKAS